jgi:hypothetical protein
MAPRMVFLDGAGTPILAAKYFEGRRGKSAEAPSPEDMNPDQEKTHDRGRGIDDH